MGVLSAHGDKNISNPKLPRALLPGLEKDQYSAIVNHMENTFCSRFTSLLFPIEMKEFHSMEINKLPQWKQDPPLKSAIIENFSSLWCTDEVTEITATPSGSANSHLHPVHLFPCSYIPNLFEQHGVPTDSWLR